MATAWAMASQRSARRWIVWRAPLEAKPCWCRSAWICTMRQPASASQACMAPLLASSGAMQADLVVFTPPSTAVELPKGVRLIPAVDWLLEESQS